MSLTSQELGYPKYTSKFSRIKCTSLEHADRDGSAKSCYAKDGTHLVDGDD